jgi:YVTN family beta-propeller protein
VRKLNNFSRDNIWSILVFATILSFSGLVLSVNVAYADQVIATISLGTWPTEFGVGVNPSTNMVYVAANGYTTTNGPVMVIDGNTNTVVAKIIVAPDTWGVGVNPNTNMIYVANSNSFKVSVIDGTTNRVVSTIPVGYWPTSIGVNPNTNMIYVANSGSNTTSVIDGTTNRVVSTIPVGKCPEGIGMNLNTNKIYVANYRSNTVSVIDGATNSVVSTIPVGNYPLDVGVNPNTNKIYVANDISNTVSVIDGATNSVVSTIPVGNYPQDIGVNPNTNKIYVVNDGTGSVSVINGTTNNVVSTILVGTDPLAIGVNPNTDRIYVANNEDQTISVIDGSSSPSGTTSQLKVNSMDSYGPLWGVQTEMYAENGTQIGAGNTPYTFTLNDNQTYTVHVENHYNYVFDHWYDTGSTNSNRTVSISSDDAIMAVYKTFPQPPRNLSATAVSLSQINISWTVPISNGGSPIIGYKIERSTNGSSTWSTIISDTNSTSTTYNDTGLDRHTGYSYRVSAMNSVGTSSSSNTATAVTYGIPTSPTNLSATAVSSSQINLAWNTPTSDGGSPITGYAIEHSTDSGSTWSTIVSNTENTTTAYSDTKLAYRTAYTYRVSAIDLDCRGPPSNTASDTTLSPVPSHPTNLFATAVSSSQINLSWTAPTDNGGFDITGYEIERSTDSGSTWSTLAVNTGSTGTTYSDTCLSANTTYMYRVSAINGMGTSSPSDTASATTPLLSVSGTNVGPVSAPSIH